MARITKRVFARDIKEGDVIIHAFTTSATNSDVTVILATVDSIDKTFVDGQLEKFHFHYSWAQSRKASEQYTGKALTFGYYDFVNVL